MGESGIRTCMSSHGGFSDWVFIAIKREFMKERICAASHV